MKQYYRQYSLYFQNYFNITLRSLETFAEHHVTIEHFGELGTREVTVAELQKLTKLFNLTTDQILNYDENIIPKEVVIEDKTIIEQMQLLEQLDEEDKSIVFKMIDKMLTSKKFKDFFAKNVSSL